jgi:hypothetical protein
MFYSFFVLLSYCRSGLKTDYKSRLYRARKGRGHGIIINKKALVFLMFKCAQAIVFPTANTTITATFPWETREWRPLLTLETEMNGDSKVTNDRGPSLEGSLGTSFRYKRLLCCLGCSGQASTKYFFPVHILFQFMYPHCPSTGSRAGTPVSECVSPTFPASSL